MDRRIFIIVGAGLAGAKAAEALREYGFEGRILLIGAEAGRPYLRPPLSKGYLRGEIESERLYIHDETFYDSNRIELRTGTMVTRIEPEASGILLSDGERLPYDRLLLSTGSRARRLSVPGADLEGIHHLHSRADADQLRERFVRGGHAVIVGAGWIGCEVAASARQSGLEVTMVHPGSVPLERALGREVGAIYDEIHRDHGVRILPGTRVRSFEGNGMVEAVRTSTGKLLPCDFAVVGIGATPATGPARETDIQIDDGIVVNEYLETNIDGIFAAGDVASTWRRLYGKLRVEHWSNALNQGPAAARNMLGYANPDDWVLDHPAPYDRLPYFYSDQYDVGMEYSGHAVNPDEVVFRGDVAARRFMVFWLRDRRIQAGMNVNLWDDTSQIQALVRSNLRVDPARLADQDIPLTDLAPRE